MQLMSRVNLRMSSESGLLGLFPARCCLATARRLAFSRVVVIFLDSEENLFWLFHKGFELDPLAIETKTKRDPSQIVRAWKRASWSIERAKVSPSKGGRLFMTDRGIFGIIRHPLSPFKRRAFVSIVVLAIVMAIGTIGMMSLEGWDAVTSLYFMALLATAEGPT